MVGEAEVVARYNKQDHRVWVQVISGDGPTLLGRNWLKKIRLNWETIKKLTDDNDLDHVLEEHNEVFKDELGYYLA